MIEMTKEELEIFRKGLEKIVEYSMNPQAAMMAGILLKEVPDVDEEEMKAVMNAYKTGTEERITYSVKMETVLTVIKGGLNERDKV